jgi:hypothetical protein
VDTTEELEARLRAAREFAPSLIGLDGREAKDQAVREGYRRSQVITPDVEALTLDLDSLRIRLFVNDLGIVVRVSAG